MPDTSETNDRNKRAPLSAERIAADLRAALNADTDLDPEDLFRFVTTDRTPQLDEQWQMLRDEIARGAASDAVSPTGGSR